MELTLLQINENLGKQSKAAMASLLQRGENKYAKDSQIRVTPPSPNPHSAAEAAWATLRTCITEQQKKERKKNTQQILFNIVSI